MKNLDIFSQWMDYGINLRSNLMYLGSFEDSKGDEVGVDFRLADFTIKALGLLDSQDRPVTILMNNIGGDEYHGMAIYDAIKECENTVTIKVYGHAMSMGSIILQAADYRIMTPNSKMMVHYGTWGHEDHALNVQRWNEEGKKFNTWMEGMYLSKIREKHPKFTRAQVKKMCQFDTILSAQETVDLGLCDEVSKI